MSSVSSTSGSFSSSATRFCGARARMGVSRPGTSSPAIAKSCAAFSVRSEKCRNASCFSPMSTKPARMAGMTFWTSPR